MNFWFVDKASKIPLYLQLKALIKHYISTGTIQDRQRLPTVKALSKELSVNFETIRKAYKDLEKEGLLTTARGKGTFANGHTRFGNDALHDSIYPGLSPIDAFRTSIKRLHLTGMPVEEIERVMDQVLKEVQSEQMIVFTECSNFQSREISEILKKELGVDVRPVLLSNLRSDVEALLQGNTKLSTVITTGFHLNEVEDVLAGLPLKIDFVITNMSPETRRAIDKYDKTARYGLIGRDPMQLHFYKDLIKAELGIESEISVSTVDDELKVKEIIGSIDVLLVSPPVYEKIRSLTPQNLPLFNVFDRIDPFSLKLLKDRLLSSA
jgi:DNA-binding transcriptional regulator YhcF (GntR family)